MAAISDNTPISRVELSDGHSIVPDYPRDTLEGKVSDLGFCVVFNFVKLITVMDKKPRYKLMFSRLQNDVGLDQDIFTAEFTQK